MPIETPSYRASGAAARCAVALLEPRREPAWAACLSAREQVRLGRLAPARQPRYIAGRLAAKHLFLRRLGADGACAPRAQPVFHALTPDALHAFSPWMYRLAEILPAAAGGGPRLYWCGVLRPERVSLAHTEGLTCASLAAGPALGLDVEQAVPRRDAFYRGNFTEGERRWVARSAWATGVPFAWLYTFLWTLKEAVLKGRLTGGARSVWDFPRIETRPLADPCAMAAAYRGVRVGEAVHAFGVEVCGPQGTARVAAAVTASHHRILTVLHTS